MQMHGHAHTSNPEEFVASVKSSSKAKNKKRIALAGNPDNLSQIQWKDLISVTIPAHSGKEYKFHLVKGATLEYSWTTDGVKLYFDFHGDPKGDTTGYFKSFAESTDNQSSGSLTIIFEGKHGWYWKNVSQSPVTVTLKTRGEYRRLDL